MTLEVNGVTHRYALENAPTVLDGVSFLLEPGEQLLLRGISGSGKTTLINILAGLLTPSEGNVRLNAGDMYALGEAARDDFRRDQIGYVFQTHHLLPILNAWENVAMPLAFRGESQAVQKERAHHLLAAVGLEDMGGIRPNKLSNGQRQRVAIARALANEPALILADEPTASLDAENGALITDLLQETARNTNTILIVASHDPTMSSRFNRIADLTYGKWVESIAAH